MCGIAGIIGSKDEEPIRKMISSLYHRGPDDYGYFDHQDIHLGITRLSIIDLVCGHQPIFNLARDKCIVFNGEIYNYRELRTELLNSGCHFTTNSDTEVILQLYEQYGLGSLQMLRGMFAFAIYDNDTILIARDRLGIKPLYYYHSDDGRLLAFASEIKALLKCDFITHAVDHQSLIDSLVFGYPVDDKTYFRDIKCLKPGHYLLVKRPGDEMKIDQRPYHHLDVRSDSSITFEEAKEKLIELLNLSISRHLVADVEIGLLLSGGVDSSIMGLIMKNYYPGAIRTYSVGDSDRNSDMTLAGVIARRIGSNHREIIMDFDRYVAAIPRYIWAEERPASLAGLPYSYLLDEIKKDLKVCLDGEGADELFGGYVMYRKRQETINSAVEGLAKIRKLGFAPRDEVSEIVEFVASARDYDEYLERIFLVGLKDQLIRYHLDSVDKLGMASSVELRVPFLDDDLVGYITKIPTAYKVKKDLGVGKYILKRAAYEAFGEIMFDVILRKKQGFPSAGYYYMSKFYQICETNLPEDYLLKHELGYCFKSKQELLLYELFSFLFIQQRGSLPDGFNMLEFIGERAGTRSLAYAD